MAGQMKVRNVEGLERAKISIADGPRWNDNTTRGIFLLGAGRGAELWAYTHTECLRVAGRATLRALAKAILREVGEK